jgi:hypothetical protein
MMAHGRDSSARVADAQLRVLHRSAVRLHELDVPETFRLRFPAHWAAAPRKNRFAQLWERETLDWLRGYDMGSSPREKERLRKFVCGDYGGYSFPLASYGGGLLVTQYISLWLFWDDMQVESELAWSVDDFVAALQGTARAEAEGVNRGVDPSSRYLLAWANLGARLRRTQSQRWTSELCATMREWLDNAKRETTIAQAWREGCVVPTYADALSCRNVSIGMYPTFLLDEFVGGFELEPDVRAHPEVQKLKHLAAGLVGFGNDLGGIAKDLKSRWLNPVAVLAANERLPLDEAFAQVVAQHNRDVLAFDACAAQLPSFGYAQDVLLTAWTDAVRHNVYGFTYWESTAQRYQEQIALFGSTPLLAPVITFERSGAASLLCH